MPLAIVFADNEIMPSIWSEDTEEILLQRLNSIVFAPELADVNSAREWLASLPEPSGWFATTQEAANYTARLKQEKRAIRRRGLTSTEQTWLVAGRLCRSNRHWRKLEHPAQNNL